MLLPIYQVDAFTKSVFSGNPAAVCPLQHWLPDQQLQLIAAENNLSETAFFVDEGTHFLLRWFTPKLEVDLCGHATLASAHVLYTHLGYQKTITFQTRSGILTVTREDDRIKMDFPTDRLHPIPVPQVLTAALPVSILETFEGKEYCMVRLVSENSLITLQPDFDRLTELNYLGIIVTAPGNQSDFVSRFFAPNAGINEDPVTGSAHCMLTPYWSRELGKTKLHAYQRSPRNGELFCEDHGERTWIFGNAVTYLAGHLTI